MNLKFRPDGTEGNGGDGPFRSVSPNSGTHGFFDTDGEGIVSCRLKVSEDAMRHRATEHANIVKAVSPESLAEGIRGEIRKANELYGIK